MTYTCATCGVTTADLTGWSKIVMQPATYDAGAPIAPFVADGSAIEHYFHGDECRTTWLARVAAPAR